MEFSHRTRAEALDRMEREEFDLLVIGGGITGAGTARDAASRGLKVALVEKSDFASGTSSRSSKLIHGGLRYLQNFELDLVFEALSERAHLIKTVPHMVRPLPFLLPVYKSDKNGLAILSAGLWLYDVLALFRAPGMHRRLSRGKMLGKVPFLKPEGLKGGFSYYDASMMDDVLTVETLRSASRMGAAIANYAEAVEPIWVDGNVRGFKVRDVSGQGAGPGAGRGGMPEGWSREVSVRAKRVVVCAGPWTDVLGRTLSSQWRRWLSPSKGVHLVFELKRIPVPGALVMSHPEDGRIAFVIPRPDMGPGVVIVGTTDGPSPENPAEVDIDRTDVDYLMGLLRKYFPALKLTEADIVSGYAGVRPLMGAPASTAGSEGQPGTPSTSESLQKISREHYIGRGPGGTVLVAGGKYTTYRRMAKEIVDVALEAWRADHKAGRTPVEPPRDLKASRTGIPVNPEAIKDLSRVRHELPDPLIVRYGGEAAEILRIHNARGVPGTISSTGTRVPDEGELPKDPDGFPLLEAQFRFNVRNGMVIRLEDFWFRRVSLFLALPDHGLQWAPRLAAVLAEELGLKGEAARAFADRQVRSLRESVERSEAWKKTL